MTKDSCSILSVRLTSVHQVWAHVGGLSSTSLRSPKAINDVMMTRYLLSETIHVGASQCNESLAISYQFALEVGDMCGLMSAVLLAPQFIVPGSLLTPW